MLVLVQARAQLGARLPQDDCAEAAAESCRASAARLERELLSLPREAREKLLASVLASVTPEAGDKMMAA